MGMVGMGMVWVWYGYGMGMGDYRTNKKKLMGRMNLWTHAGRAKPLWDYEFLGVVTYTFS